MQYIILCTNKDLYSVSRLYQSFINDGLNVKLMNIDELRAAVNQLTKQCVIINRISGISYNDDDLEFLEDNNLTVVNPTACSRIFRDKFKQAQHFQQNQIDHVKTYHLENVHNISDINGKVILKPIRSNQARGIRIFKDLDTLKDETKEYTDKRYVVQELVTRKNEWRVFVINGKIQNILVKQVDDQEALLNCANAKLEDVSLKQAPGQLLDLTNKLLASTELFYTAIDFIENEESDFLILEVNSIPGLNYVSKVGKRDMAALLCGEINNEFSTT